MSGHEHACVSDAIAEEKDLYPNTGATCNGEYMQVRLSVQKDCCGSISPPYGQSFFLSNVPEGTTLLQVMNQAVREVGFKYESENHPTLGAYITSVGGKKADKALQQY